VTRLDPGLGTEGLAPVVDDPAIDLGYRYRSSSFTPDGPDDGTGWEDPRAPSGQPGLRAPHVVVRRDGADQSTLDLIHRDAVLVAGPPGAAWARAAAATAEALRVPLDVYRLDADLDDAHGEFAKAYGIGPDGAVLIRPDGFVAWRARDAAADDGAAADALGGAVARMVGRPGAT
jgi:hypothetical protein